jgi:hypothetical protein
MGGKFSVDSKLDVGTTFEIKFSLKSKGSHQISNYISDEYVLDKNDGSLPILDQDSF